MPTAFAVGVWVMRYWQLILVGLGIIFVVFGCRWLLKEQRSQHEAQQMPGWRLTDDNTPRG